MTPLIAAAMTIEAPEQSTQPYVSHRQHVCTIPALTEVRLETVADVSSATAKNGDPFQLRLVEPLLRDAQLVLPTGLLGVGEVIHAARASWSGRAGELILAARFLEFRGSKIPLRSLRLSAAGKKAIGYTNVIGVGIFPNYSSADTTIPKGTVAIAKVSSDVTIPC